MKKWMVIILVMGLLVALTGCDILFELLGLGGEEEIEAPTGVSAVYNAGSGTVTISWNEVDGAESYIVYGSYTTSGYGELGTVTGTTATYTLTPEDYGNTLYFVVKAVDADGNTSDYSGYDSVFIPAGGATPTPTPQPQETPTPIPGTDENESFDTAVDLWVDYPETDTLYSEDDEDYYSVDLVADTTYNISLTNVPAEGDYRISLYDSSESFIETEDSGYAGADELLTFTPITTGTYYIMVDTYGGFDDVNEYTIEVTAEGGTPTPTPSSGGTGTSDDPKLLTLDIPFDDTVGWDWMYYSVDVTAGLTYTVTLTSVTGDPRITAIQETDYYGTDIGSYSEDYLSASATASTSTLFIEIEGWETSNTYTIEVTAAGGVPTPTPGPTGGDLDITIQ